MKIAPDEDAVRDGLDALVVLRVNRMAVATVSPSPSVVIDDAAVHLTVLGGDPPAYALRVIVDDEVDELAVSTSIDIQSTPRTVHVRISRVGRNWR